MEVYISKKLSDRWPQTQLGLVRYDVSVKPSDPAIRAAVEAACKEAVPGDQISKLPAVHETREAYKAFGKSPSKYRNAGEALLRQVAKKHTLPAVNAIVDLQNSVSIMTGYSIGSYDIDQLEGHVIFDIAPEPSSYQDIHGHSFNIAHLPVLYDETGPFGNPTRDSARAMITEQSRHILTVFYVFGSEDIADVLLGFEDLLKQYTDAEQIELSIVDVPQAD
ncbi:B3/B4 domain-containing protein [Catenisphaera adipataccumulans]|jgi:DNA/RNA-binding domain of Phe-tRNA-synthetase-like protein|uniref:DNA/RNA-binding domain of Phe-tRNA-synthetase-like protein n=1 Tax=Catenisphaera adipataccumulans TaxID=700500 RepID=A0A7W8CVH4_9FIRM|nr:phenylalanine--tRNA ligase beta subunit-related protein [Catenisphaera adipataccumulans]MBB5182340.1 DNA/RNA-binding domain of Phe-tRNA-synthetase-like protein [Catenisphaera adipataccumulans]